MEWIIAMRLPVCATWILLHGIMIHLKVQNPGCSFRQVVTEFSCQGLEVDLPILCWGPDMIWNGNAWNLYRPMQSADSNDNRYRVNSYRVLLTRGRDGLLVFVPPESKLSPIYDLLCKVGWRNYKNYRRVVVHGLLPSIFSIFWVISKCLATVCLVTLVPLAR